MLDSHQRYICSVGNVAKKQRFAVLENSLIFIRLISVCVN
jgi:hypothetical protein